jgi:hypothetical protein
MPDCLPFIKSVKSAKGAIIAVIAGFSIAGLSILIMLIISVIRNSPLDPVYSVLLIVILVPGSLLLYYLNKKRMTMNDMVTRRAIHADIGAGLATDHEQLRSRYKTSEPVIASAMTKTVAEWDALIARSVSRERFIFMCAILVFAGMLLLSFIPR